MRIPYIIAMATFCLVEAAAAQNPGDRTIPNEIGNRANGFDYQPTPNEVDSREKAAGVRPSSSDQDATDKELEAIDRNLLQSEGLSTSSVPKMTPR
jgi:hypothetical protein